LSANQSTERRGRILLVSEGTGVLLKTVMKVSCICPTYNRPPNYQWLVEEAIESFLRQDYPNKELIVLNDCPGQELICDAPDVFVINLPRRFRSYGEKLNAGIALAQGSIIAPWNDDDIMLPWRLSTSLSRLAGSGYYNPQVYWFLDPQGLHKDHAMGVGHICSIFTRFAFDLVDGYPHTTGEEDQILDHRLKSHPNVKTASPPILRIHEWFYIYRWGVSPVHLSSRQPIDEWYNQIGQMPVEQGQYFLRPHWKEDYLSRTRNAIGISPFQA
jgi:glycosyltransferase involved in cell wall biosynthesis